MAIAFGPRTPPTPKPPEVVTYVRPADWLELPEVLETDQKFVGLAAIREGDINRIRLRAQGAFTVDWGDGTVENFASNTVASHDYDYDDVALDGTLSTRGYKQVIVTLTPQSGQNLTLLDLSQSLTGSAYVKNSFLDVRLGSPNFTSLTFRAINIPNQNMLMLEQVEIVNLGNITNIDSLFLALHNLKSASISNMGFVTDTSRLFTICTSLLSVSLSDTSSVTEMIAMFFGCSSLTTVPLFDTSSVVNMNRMFDQCQLLTSIPPFDTSSVTVFDVFISGRSNTFFNSDELTANLTSIKIAPINASFDINRSPRLGREAIVEVFNNLSDRTGLSSLTIHIGNNASVEPIGVSELTQTDRDIALNKNWTIVG